MVDIMSNAKCMDSQEKLLTAWCLEGPRHARLMTSLSTSTQTMSDSTSTKTPLTDPILHSTVPFYVEAGPPLICVSTIFLDSTRGRSTCLIKKKNIHP